MPFLIIVAPIIALVFKEPDLGTTIVITLTVFTMFFVAGANLLHLAVMVGGARRGGASSSACSGYQLDRIRVWQDPWPDRSGEGFHTVQGLLALGVGGFFGTGLGKSRVSVPNAFNDFIFAEVGQEFGMFGAVVVIALFLLLAYSGVRVALAAPDTFGALLAAGITAWLCLQAFINIGVVVALLPITGITLPFISAGGSSLIISFAAVGILLSISRETVEKGTWNDDATADRGRRDGRTHLPGARRRAFAPRSVRTRPSSAGWAAIAASRRASSRPPGIPLRRLAARSLRTTDADIHARPRPAPARRLRAAGGRDPRRRATGRDLHDRRLRRGPGADGRRAAAASRS